MTDVKSFLQLWAEQCGKYTGRQCQTECPFRFMSGGCPDIDDWQKVDQVMAELKERGVSL